MNKLFYIFSLSLFSIFSNAQSIENIIKSDPFKVTGSIGGNVGLYSVSGIDQRTSPFQYGLSARLNFNIYSFSIPVYASIRDNTFNYGGTFSRFRINPQYKWVKLHIGDTYMKFNPYTLSGRTVKGYGVELTPGKFRFRFLKGKVEDLRSYTDSLQLGTTFTPTYSRKVTAVALGYGSSSTYIDLYGVTSADRLDSLNGEKINTDFTRMSNTVLGSTFALRIMKGLSLRSNVGLSFQTENLDSPGENTTIGGNPISGNLVEANLSSNVTYAGDIGLNYSNRLFSLNGRVKYIQPYFQPLTVAFLNTDIINYTIGGSTGFFRRRLNVSGSIGIQRNNLTGRKLSTSNNLITNIAANFRLGKGFSGTLTYSNFTQDYEARLIQINDLYTYAISSSVAAASLNYTIKRGNMNYKVGIKGGQNDFLTVDDQETDLSAYDSWNGGVNFGVSNPEKFTSINSSVTYRKYNRQTSTSANYGLRLSGNKGFYENKLRLNINTAFSYNDRDGLREGNTWRNGVALMYKLNKKSNLALRLNHIRRTSSIRSNFTEYRSGVQYLHSF